MSLDSGRMLWRLNQVLLPEPGSPIDSTTAPFGFLRGWQAGLQVRRLRWALRPRRLRRSDHPAWAGPAAAPRARLAGCHVRDGRGGGCGRAGTAADGSSSAASFSAAGCDSCKIGLVGLSFEFGLPARRLASSSRRIGKFGLQGSGIVLPRLFVWRFAALAAVTHPSAHVALLTRFPRLGAIWAYSPFVAATAFTFVICGIASP